MNRLELNPQYREGLLLQLLYAIDTDVLDKFVIAWSIGLIILYLILIVILIIKSLYMRMIA
jgi:hypothetical protein